ncbi:MAG: restriction endonuclease subunit S [Cytophagaceae bacterium]|nr:MAG: restriction endonuclease subunit S [Cytophagaceae bacterium]
MDVIDSISIPLPPIPEQRKIAEILSTLDEKMAVMDEQLAQTQELKKGLMQRLLTKGIGHTQFKDSPLGEIPASWDVNQLDSCLSLITYGFTNPMPSSYGHWRIT